MKRFHQIPFLDLVVSWLLAMIVVLAWVVFGFHKLRQQDQGRVIDRARAVLPALTAEQEEGRKMNFERCQVGLDVYIQSGAIKGLTQDGIYRFGVLVDRKTWDLRDDQEDIMDMAACYFAAGDARTKLQVPIYDLLSNQRIGVWIDGGEKEDVIVRP